MMSVSIPRPVQVAAMTFGLMVGTAVATVVGLGMAGLLASAQAAPNAQACSASWPFGIEGTWYRDGNPNSPSMVGGPSGSIDLINEFGSVARGAVYGDRRITVIESVSPGRDGNRWSPGLGATLVSEDGGVSYTIIQWDNGTSWRR